MSEKDQSQYRAYLLRCWQERTDNEGQLDWRFALISLTEIQTRHGFGSLAVLVDFLQDELSAIRGKKEGGMKSDQ